MAPSRNRGAEAKLFMEDYYRTFDANRADLVNLYREESVLNFEGWEMIKGKEAIVAKLTSLQCQYQISKIVCVPHLPTRGAVAQSFHLYPTPQGSFWVALENWSTYDWRQKRHYLCNASYA